MNAPRELWSDKTANNYQLATQHTLYIAFISEIEEEIVSNEWYRISEARKYPLKTQEFYKNEDILFIKFYPIIFILKRDGNCFQQRHYFSLESKDTTIHIKWKLFTENYFQLCPSLQAKREEIKNIYRSFKQRIFTRIRWINRKFIAFFIIEIYLNRTLFS